MTVLGLLILGLAPQAQDLFVEFADVPVWRMVLFGCVMVVVWSMPTHYAARLLLDTDERFRQLLEAQRGVRSGTFPRSRGKVASPGPAGRQHHVTCSPRWTASPLHPSLSFWYTQAGATDRGGIPSRRSLGICAAALGHRLRAGGHFSTTMRKASRRSTSLSCRRLRSRPSIVCWLPVCTECMACPRSASGFVRVGLKQVCTNVSGP